MFANLKAKDEDGDWLDQSRSSVQTASKEEEQKKFKTLLTQYYGTNGCMVLLPNADFDVGLPPELRAAHIWPKHKVDRFCSKFGKSEEDIVSARNGLLLSKEIELAFDQRRCTFVYDGLKAKWVLVVVDPSLLDVPIGRKTFRDLNDGAHFLHFSEEKKPFLRILYAHTRATLFKAKDFGWKVDNETAAYVASCRQLSDDTHLRDLAKKQEKLEEMMATGKTKLTPSLSVPINRVLYTSDFLSNITRSGQPLDAYMKELKEKKEQKNETDDAGLPVLEVMSTLDEKGFSYYTTNNEELYALKSVGFSKVPVRLIPFDNSLLKSNSKGLVATVTSS